MYKVSQLIEEEQELFLIWLYLFIAEAYEKFLFANCERFSNNSKQVFTDIELLTICLFGQILGFDTQKKNYKYIRNHYLPWFQKLPIYTSCNKRLRFIISAFLGLIEMA